MIVPGVVSFWSLSSSFALETGITWCFGKFSLEHLLCELPTQYFSLDVAETYHLVLHDQQDWCMTGARKYQRLIISSINFFVHGELRCSFTSTQDD